MKWRGAGETNDSESGAEARQFKQQGNSASDGFFAYHQQTCVRLQTTRQCPDGFCQLCFRNGTDAVAVELTHVLRGGGVGMQTFLTTSVAKGLQSRSPKTWISPLHHIIIIVQVRRASVRPATALILSDSAATFGRTFDRAPCAWVCLGARENFQMR